MRTEDAWWLKTNCKDLTPQEADEMFFPSVAGKKSHAAKAFCNDCPMIHICLSEAVSTGLPGFMAGTTVPERMHMRSFVRETRALLMPEEPDRTVRQIYLAIKPLSDDHEWMDEVDAPDTVIAALDGLPPTDALWDLVS